MIDNLQVWQRLANHLHQGGAYAYYWFGGNGQGDKESSWHAAGNNGTVPKAVNVWFGIHPTTDIPRTNAKGEPKDSKYVRSQKKLIAAVSCLFGEFDVKTEDRPEGLESKAAALAHIRGLAIQPSVIIDSGSGYHCYWLLDAPFMIGNDADRERIDRIQKAWVTMVGSDDGAKDLARVLRVPGTTNGKYKPARPVTCVDDSFTTYKLTDLQAAIPTKSDPAPAQSARAHMGSAYAQAALSGELAKVNAAQPGARNATLNGAAFALGQLIGAGALDQATVERELEAAALHIRLVEEEFHKTIQSGLTAGIAHPRTLPTNGRADPGAHVDLSAAPGDTPTPEGTAPAVQSTCTDSHNAERFARQHASRARYVPAWGWLVYDGKRWKRDDSDHVIALARTTARSIYHECASVKVDAIRDKLAEWAKASLAMARLDAMVRGARDLMRADSSDFDKDLMLLNVGNGTLDLRTRVLRKHDPADLITHLAGTDYMPGATCPLWLAFLKRIMADDSMIAYLQRAAGLTLTGDVGERCFHDLYGEGNNGKSTLTETLQATMGDYAGRVRVEALLLKREGTIPNDIAALVGMRLVIASEIPKERKLDEGLIKDLTGKDTMSARFLHHEFFNFKPQFKLWLFGNSKPVIRGTDNAIWGRVRLIPFDVVIQPDDIDTHFPDKLLAELPGILAWAVEGCKAWQAGGLKPPDKVTAATKQYRAEMDVVAEFIDECCVLNSNAITHKGALYEAYTRWASGDPVSKIEFGKQLKAHGVTEGDRAHGGNRQWRGIGLDIIAPGSGDR